MQISLLRLQETCIILPQLGLALDTGRCPQRSAFQRTLLLSHAHMDHIGGLPFHVATRQVACSKDSVVEPSILEIASFAHAQLRAFSCSRGWLCRAGYSVQFAEHGISHSRISFGSIFNKASSLVVPALPAQRLRPCTPPPLQMHVALDAVSRI